MRILQVTPGYPPAIGGIEHHVQALSEALARDGHEVVVATLSADRQPQIEHRAGVEVRRFVAVGPSAYRVPIGLVSFLHRSGSTFDVIHAHNYHAIPLLQAVVACRGRVIISPYYHGCGHSKLANVLHRIYDPWAIAALRWVGGAVCLSAGEANLVEQRLGIPRERIAILPSGIIRSADTDERHIRRNPDLLLCVGRLESYKHLERAIGALAYLPERYRLMVVGTGPERSRLEQLSAQIGVQRRVVFLGRVGDRELHELYHQAQVVMSFSAAESFGITILEAVAAGCRVVCSDIPAFRDFATEFPGTVALATATMSDRDLATPIQAVAAQPAAAVDLQRYCWSRILADLIPIYEKVSTRSGAVRVAFRAGYQSPLRDLH